MAQASTPPAIELLLADAHTGTPTLPEGLAADAALSARKPTKAQGARDTKFLDAPGDDPNNLSYQRWGVVAPEGPPGDELLRSIAQLIALREAEQGAKASVYRVPPNMNPAEASAWREKVYLSEAVAEIDRPRYLLILGGLETISLSLQQALATMAFVGRLHFDEQSGYAAYAEKACRYAEGASPHAAADALFYAARDPSMTTIAGYKQLVKPCFEAATSLKRSGKLTAESVVEVTRWGAKLNEFMEPAAGPRPAVLLSSSHGVGVGRSEPLERRRSLQGALSLGTAGTLSAEALRGARFLPGGVWFCVACFSAGTPLDSAYGAWLSELAKDRAAPANLDAVFGTLPGPGEPPFVAALPQAALSSMEGPLAFIGHMDLAWSYSFLSTETFSEGRPSRIFSALRVLLSGGRAGVAHGALMRSYLEANDDLLAIYQVQQDSKMFGHADPTDPWRRCHLWMLRNDLRGYVLLGDPAARLPLKGSETGTSSRASSGGSLGKAGAQADAVAELLRGQEAPIAIAARYGVSLDVLWGWLWESRPAGR